MNRTPTMPRLPATAQRDSFPRRSARLLLRGPATLTSPVARWAVTLLAVAGAALLVWSGVIHLQLWSDGYRSISVIGPLFLIQGIASIVLAVALAAFRRLVLLAAGAVLAAATAAGLLLSAGIGLFGYVGEPGGSVRRDVPGRGVHQRGGARGRRGHRPGRPASAPPLIMRGPRGNPFAPPARM